MSERQSSEVASAAEQQEVDAHADLLVSIAYANASDIKAALVRHRVKMGERTCFTCRFATKVGNGECALCDRSYSEWEGA